VVVRSSAGARGCTTGSCCRTGCGATSHEVLDQLAARGVALPVAAFEPLSSCACPLVGTMEAGGGHRRDPQRGSSRGTSLGEGGRRRADTARYVDSSMERIEIRTTRPPIPSDTRFAVNRNTRVARCDTEAGTRPCRSDGVTVYGRGSAATRLPTHTSESTQPLHIEVVDLDGRSRGVAGGALSRLAYRAGPCVRLPAPADSRRGGGAHGLQRFTLDGPSRGTVIVRGSRAASRTKPYHRSICRRYALRPTPNPEAGSPDK